MATPIHHPPKAFVNQQQSHRDNTGERTTTCSPSPSPSSSCRTLCSTSLKQVYLQDWWLINTDRDSNGRKLGVAGCRKHGLKLFYSAPIGKRIDSITLETVDGIKVSVLGCINKSLTLENGFSSEVCDAFHFGFPYNWEAYAYRFSDKRPTEETFLKGNTGASRSELSPASGSSRSLPMSFHDLPVTVVRDLWTSSLTGPDHRVLSERILDEILQNYNSNACNQTETSGLADEEISCQGKTRTRPKKESKSKIRPGDEHNEPEPKFRKTEFQKRSLSFGQIEPSLASDASGKRMDSILNTKDSRSRIVGAPRIVEESSNRSAVRRSSRFLKT